MQLEGKVAVITGAASGNGRAMATLFAQKGAKIVAADWHADSLDAVVAELRATGANVTSIQGNVAEKSDAEKIIDTAVATYGRIDILCNNAGVMDLFQG